MPTSQTSITVKVQTDELDKLETAAKKTGISIADAVRQAISIETILTDAKSRGAKIIIEEKDHAIKEMIF